MSISNRKNQRRVRNRQVPSNPAQAAQAAMDWHLKVPPGQQVQSSTPGSTSQWQRRGR